MLTNVVIKEQSTVKDKKYESEPVFWGNKLCAEGCLLWGFGELGFFHWKQGPGNSRDNLVVASLQGYD